MMIIKKEIKYYHLRMMLYLDHVYQKSITHLQTMEKISILLCQYVICQNIVTIIVWHQELFWNYYRDEINDDTNKNNAAKNRINNNNTIISKSFE